VKLSAAGLDYPDELISELRAGDVVFLCGAGVSYPAGLPTFGKLVTQIYHRVSTQQNSFEQQMFKENRFDECLGSLAGRIADKKDIHRATTELLRPKRTVPLDAHHTILRLSTTQSADRIVVTTNFDNLFERALHTRLKVPKSIVRKLSSASTSIPAPGGDRFRGVIHLHGRISDATLAMDDTDLVLTSGQFGTAYMRDGWATRFLLDLVRCRTVVMVGYSAEDPPFRYILHVLGVERDRFKLSKQVYVVSPVDSLNFSDLTVPTEKWMALNVRPIFYVPSDNDHSNLWSDLRQLADNLERSSAWVAQTVAHIVGRPFAESSDGDRSHVVSMFGQHPDAASISLIEHADDGEWLAFFAKQNMIQKS